MNTTRSAACVALLFAWACQGRGDAAVASPEPTTAAGPSRGAEAAYARNRDAPFLWRLRLQPFGAEASSVFPEVAHGRVPQQADPWVCDYSLEDVSVDESADQARAEQFGVLACASSRSGMRAAALVMCMQSPDRPSDCGAGNVHVADAGGNGHTFSLACATADSDCFARPEATPFPEHGAARAEAMAVASGRDADAEVDGEFTEFLPQAEWSVNLFREGFGDRRVTLEDSSGGLPSVTDAWRCFYSVEPGATLDGVRAEIGAVTCITETGESVGTRAVCIWPEGGGEFSNAAAIRLSGPETPDVALMLDCTSEA